MRRIAFTAVASSVRALAAPSVALAHGTHHHRRHHHARHARLVRFGPATALPGASGQGAPQAPANESAGTVASYDGGVLKITLGDGSSVSGKVTEQTFIAVVPASSQGGPQGWHGDERHPPFHGRSGQSGEHRAWADCFGGGGSGSIGFPSANAQDALVAGATVEAAELSFGPGGAVWRYVEVLGR